ncbi:MAG: AbrB/MazE/SpoVT family DNA-binding domain-containing protein [Bacilli bacterium]|nr:AbrB/MazE/SpoVT family DNA-binding domain-containing protein [Bacilli bacterium]
MKTTGIIRRIDDLGRIVIPKEIRRNLRIKNGDSLEVFVDMESVVLKKYSPMESVEDMASKYVDSFNQVIKHNIIICDKDKVIAASGNLKKNYFGKNISEFTERSIERRDSFVERQKKTFSFVEGVEDFGYYSFSSIINNGDTLGAVIIISIDRPITDSEEKLAPILSNLLSNKFVYE